MDLAPSHNLSVRVREGEKKNVNVCEYLLSESRQLQSFKGTVHPTIKQVSPLFLGLHPGRFDVNRSVLVLSAFSPI